MSGAAAPADLPSPSGAELDETGFRSVAEKLTVTGEPGHGQSLRLAIAESLEAMARGLGEHWIGGDPWNPKDKLSHTKGVLDQKRDKFREDLEHKLGEWTRHLDADRQIRMLVHLWWECFGLWDRSLAYRTIEAVAGAVAGLVDQNLHKDWPRWKQDAVRAVGDALQLMRWDGQVFAQINLSCATKIRDITLKAIEELTATRDKLRSAWDQFKDQPDDAGKLIAPCLAYIWGYADQVVVFYRVMEKMAGALMEFEDWLSLAEAAGPSGATALRTLSLRRAPRASIVGSLKYLAEVKGNLSSHTLSEIEPWEQMLIQLRDLITVGQDGNVTCSVLIPRRVWVRYCFPFAVRNDDHGERAKRLLSTLPDSDPNETPSDRGPGQHPLSVRLQEELTKVGLGLMGIGEPTALAQTEFFQVRTGDDGHFGGIRIDLPDLTFRPDFLDGPASRPYRAWFDLNRMGNFCLCVEAAEPLTEIAPPRLYRALRAGTPFVFGELVGLASRAADQPPEWDNLHTFAREMIRAAADAYYYSTRSHEEQDASADSGLRYVVRANLHEVVVVQTDAPIAVQSEEIASRLDGAVGGRILLRSLQRAAGTLEEWIRFPPLQRAEQHGRGAAVVAVPEIGHAGDWLVHTGETTVIGIVAVPSWFREVYLEAAQFASSWSPVLQLWNQRLQAAIKKSGSDGKDDDINDASEELREVEQQVRQHLAGVNAEDLCATLAYRRFLDILLDAVGIGRLEKELQAQLQAAEQMTDYFSQKQVRKAGERRDILLLFIALFGVFSVADFLALLDTTDYHGSIGFIGLSQDGRWQDLLVLILFVLALVGGVLVWLRGGLRRRLLFKMRETWKSKASGRGQ
jgi:hypothetical protein